MEKEIRARIKESYNQNSKYRETDEIIEWKLPIIKKFTEYMTDKSLKKVLDLGSGSGSYAKLFTKNNFDVKCIDASESMIQLCLSKGLNAEVMDFYELNFDDNSFDAIWSLNTLLHVPKRSISIVLEGINRVLKQNGVFYLGIYGGESSEGVYEDDFYKPQRYFSRYTDSELKEVLNEYFEIIEFQHIDIGKSDYWFQSVYLRSN